jgi:hypothetical protein
MAIRDLAILHSLDIEIDVIRRLASHQSILASGRGLLTEEGLR